MPHPSSERFPLPGIWLGHCQLTLAGLIAFLSFFGCEHQSANSPEIASAEDSNELPHAAVVNASAIDFLDVAHERGLRCVLPEQPRPMRTLESFGSGCASFDFDQDGWQDILVITDPSPALFHNENKGHFRQIDSAIAFPNLKPADWTGCAVGDYNGDGWLDLLLTGYHRLSLLQNDNGKLFLDVTREMGLDSSNHDHWGAGAGFMDLDGDQWLELVILNYVNFGPDSKQYCEDGKGGNTSCPPTAYDPEKGEIWRNIGGRKFELTPSTDGMANTSGVGLVLAFTDLDQDGLCDFYIGNDAVNADLMLNQGRLKFENESMVAGVAVNRKLTAVAAMGADWGDFDRDGLLDLTVTDFQDKGSVLFRNVGNSLFSDLSEMVGIQQATQDQLGFGLNWLDFENDGWLDVGFVNGHVYENISTWKPEVHYRQAISLMQNLNGQWFRKLNTQLRPEVSRAIVGRGSASTDFDNDGRMDFLIVDYEGPVMLLHNQTPYRNHWLKLELHGKPPNTYAYGARVFATTKGQNWTEQISPSSSYLSSKDPRIHLGLGENDHLDEVRIRWPSGQMQVLKHVSADQILQIEEPEDLR